MQARMAVAILLCGFVSRTMAADIAGAGSGDADRRVVVSNPYSRVEWATTRGHRAALHVHTLQSDGFNTVDEVVRAYRKAGFSIISVTDHDWNEPNRRIVGNWGPLPPEKASPYPKDPKPHNYPANPTWPWTDYGAPAPADLGAIGIQGNELTYKHHILSYYSDYGVWYGTPGERIGREAPYTILDSDGGEVCEDDQLTAVRNKGGLAVLCHPGISDAHGWWQRQPLAWYVERFRRHAPDCLVGIEVTNHRATGRGFYDEGLWDQLLARFMPGRPIWGFGNDDVHDLRNAKATWNVFFLRELSDATVREALTAGQFCFFASTGSIDYTEPAPARAPHPCIREIAVDRSGTVITISADHYDEIRWISAPASLEAVEDYRTSDQPWPAGEVVHVGNTLDVRAHPGVRNYVRAEIIRRLGDREDRLFTNPFGIGMR